MGDFFKDSFAVFALLLSALVLAPRVGRMRGLPAALRGLRPQILRSGAFVLAAAVLAMQAANIVNPKPWDYPPLYLAARAAAEGRSLYAPQSLLASHAELADQIEFPSVYLDTVVTPFNPYPPVTSLFTAPLGMLGYRLSLAIHCAFQALFFVGAVFLLRSITVRLGAAVGVTESFVLTLAFAPVLSAFGLAQNVFGALFFVALWLVLAERRPLAAGVALGAAFPFKPVVLIVGALSAFAVTRRSAAAFVGVVTALLGLAALVFGPSAFAEYARWGTAVPFHHYVEPVAQSLLAVVYRLTDFVPAARIDPNHAFHPPFLVAAVTIAMTTLLILLRAGSDEASRQLKRVLAVLLALLVYPGSLFNTLPLMLPVFFVMLGLSERLPIHKAWVVAFIFVEYALVAIRVDDSWWFHGGFPAMLLAWIVVAGLLLRLRDVGESSSPVEVGLVCSEPWQGLGESAS